MIDIERFKGVLRKAHETLHAVDFLLLRARTPTPPGLAPLRLAPPTEAEVEDVARQVIEAHALIHEFEADPEERAQELPFTGDA